MHDVGIMLQQRDTGVPMPKELILQFDNCGENKVRCVLQCGTGTLVVCAVISMFAISQSKIMFCFLSLLVEKFIFDKITVNFLIVGHTHASINQFFSVLSGAIKDSDWIATPISLRQLLKSAHKELRFQPKVIRELIVYHDWASFLTNKCCNKTVSVSN